MGVIVCNWVDIVAENKTGTDGFGYTVVEKSVFFYAKDGLNRYANPMLLQCGLNVLTGLFEQAGTRTKISMKVAMVCHPEPIYRRHSDTAYEQQMTSKKYPNQVRQCGRVVRGKCGVHLAAASTPVHLHDIGHN